MIIIREKTTANGQWLRQARELSFKVSIITLIAYRPLCEIREYLESTSRLTYSNLEIIILINNPDRRYSQEIIKIAKKYQKVKIINNHANLGFTKGVNLGLKNALSHDTEYTLLLNDDVYVKRNLIEKLLVPFKEDSKLGLSSPLIMQFPKTDLIWCAGLSWNRIFGFSRAKKFNQKLKRRTKSGYADILSGCCLMVKKSVWQKIGFLDEDLFMYFDDFDLSIRAGEAGYKKFVVGEPLVYHRKSGNTLSSFEAYYFGRNPFILIRKYFTGYKKITAYFGQFFIRLPRNYFRMQNQKAFRSYLRGMRDGIRGIIK